VQALSLWSSSYLWGGAVLVLGIFIGVAAAEAL